MVAHRKYSDQTLVDAVQSSTNWAEVIRKIGLVKSSSTYKYVQGRAKNSKLDISHFNRKRLNTRKPLDQLGKSRGSIRKRLLELGVPLQCAICGITNWLKARLPLDLDHVNGVNDDNRLENLRFLCPNCHAQTPTYRGRNKRHL